MLSAIKVIKNLISNNKVLSFLLYVFILIIIIRSSQQLKEFSQPLYFILLGLLVSPLAIACVIIVVLLIYETIKKLELELKEEECIKGKILVIGNNYWQILGALFLLQYPFWGIISYLFPDYSYVIGMTLAYLFSFLVFAWIYAKICKEVYTFMHKIYNNNLRVFLSIFLPVAIPCTIVLFFYLLGDKNTNIFFEYLALIIEYGFYLFLILCALCIALGLLVFAFQIVIAILSEAGCVFVLAIIGLIAVLKFIFF